jgi:hypothetical protein
MTHRHLWTIFILLSLTIAAFAWAQANKQQPTHPKLDPRRPFGEYEAVLPTPIPVRPVAVKSPLVGKQMKDARASWFAIQLGFQGRLVYAWDTAHYGPAGFSWPWDSYLVFRHFGESAGEARAAGNTTSLVSHPVSHQVDTPFQTFLFEPQFSPNGEHVLFKVGDPDSSFGTYVPYIWNLKTQQLRKVEAPNQSIGYRLILWSYNSRYIAYLRGATNIPFGGSVPAELHVYDVQTGTDRSIVKNEGIINSVAWASNDNLLFTVLSKLKKDQQAQNSRKSERDDVDSGEHIAPIQLDIYEAPAALGHPKLLIRHGYRPNVSPDGKWIAFFGSPDVDQSQKWSLDYFHSSWGTYLLLSDRIGKERKIIRREQGGRYSILRWMPDSQHLLVIKPSYKGEGTVEARITEFDVHTLKERHIAVIGYKDKFKMDTEEERALFRPLQVSKDGKSFSSNCHSLSKMIQLIMACS